MMEEDRGRSLELKATDNILMLLLLLLPLLLVPLADTTPVTATTAAVAAGNVAAATAAGAVLFSYSGDVFTAANNLLLYVPPSPLSALTVID